MRAEIPSALVEAVWNAEQAGADAVKARARAICNFDRATGGRAIREMCEALRDMGLSLTTHQVQRARKIGPMLYALHPEGRPPDLSGWWGEEDTLYWLARSAEVARRRPADLLAALRALHTQEAREAQLRVWSGRAEPIDRSDWVPPLLPVPDETAAHYRAGHSKFANALGATDLQATEAMARIMNDASGDLWRSLDRFDPASLQAVGSALWGALRCLPVPAEEQGRALAHVLLNMQPGYWIALHRELLKATGGASKQTSKQD